MMAPVTKQSKGTGTTLKVAQAAGKFKAAVKKKK
jgi:hypothetical protein